MAEALRVSPEELQEEEVLRLHSSEVAETEQQELSPEEKFARDVARLERNADEFVDQRVAEQSVQQAPETTRREPPKPLPSINDEIARIRQYGQLKSNRSRILALRLRLSGIKLDERMLAVIDYLSRTPDDSYFSTKVEVGSPEERRRTIDHYTRQGYVIVSGGADYLEFQKRYEFSLKDARAVSELSRCADDPIAVLEAIRRSGYKFYGGSSLKKLPEVIVAFDDEEVESVLELASSLGLHIGLRRYSTSPELVARTQEIKDSPIAPISREERERLQSIVDAIVVSEADREFGPTMLARLVQLAKDPAQTASFIALTRRYQEAANRPFVVHIVDFITALKEQGLLDNLDRIVGSDLTQVPHFVHQALMVGLSDEKRRALRGEFNAYFNSPVLSELESDADYRSSCQKLSVIFGRPLSVDELTAWRETSKLPGALALVEAFREWSDLSDAEPSHKYYSLPQSFVIRLRTILSDERSRQLVVSAEFDRFVRRMQGELGFSRDLEQLADAVIPKKADEPSGAVRVFMDEELTRQVFSGEVARVARLVEWFDPNQIDRYVHFAQAPGVADFMEATKGVYWDAPRQKYNFESLMSALSAVSSDEQLRSVLATPAAMELYSKMQQVSHLESHGLLTGFDYPNMKAFAEILQSPELVKWLTSPASASFIAKFQGTSFSFEHAATLYEHYRAVPDLTVAVYQKLGISPGFDNTTAGLDYLRDLNRDGARQRALLTPERLEVLKYLRSEHYYYPGLAGLPAVEKLPPGFKDFIERLGGCVHPDLSTRLNINRDNIDFLIEASQEEKLIPAIEAFNSAVGRKLNQSELADFWALLGRYSPERVIELCSHLSLEGVKVGYSPDIATVKNPIEILLAREASAEDCLEIARLMAEQGTEVLSVSGAIEFLLMKDNPDLKAEIASRSVVRVFENPELYRQIAQKPELLDEIPGLLRQGLLDDRIFAGAILSDLDGFLSLPDEKREQYIALYRRIDGSPSQEIQRLKGELLEQLLLVDDPVGGFDAIESVFEKNNLPTIGKVFKVFQILHPEATLRKKIGAVRSPRLKEASPRRVFFTLYQDLLRINILSGNRSFRDYLETIRSGQAILDRFESGGELSQDETEQLGGFLDRADTLFENSQLGERARLRGEERGARQVPDIGERVAFIRQSMGVKEGQTISGRVEEMFLRPIGLSSIDAALEIMRSAKREAQIRATETVGEASDGQLQIEEGDLLKGVDIRFIDKILQNGSVAKEFLGSGADSDSTPLDTDLAVVDAASAERPFEEILRGSMANGYGEVMFVLKNRASHPEQPQSADSRCGWEPEIFKTGVMGEAHYGIRTGFPTTDIGFIIAKSEVVLDPRQLTYLFTEIAKNGWYIPVVDETGRIIFYPDDYQKFRQSFEGIARFDGDNYHFAQMPPESPLAGEVEVLKPEISANAERTRRLEEMIVSTITGVLAEFGVRMKGRHSHSIRGTEIFQTGSSGRHTNVPGKFDFDFSAYLDVDDFPKSPQIAARLREVMSPASDNSHGTAEDYFQIRFAGVPLDGESVDIDIGLGKKSELLYFASHDGVSARLGWIRTNHGEDAYLATLANIVLAKKMLSEAHAYKKTEESGLGGIGVENWILQNGGSFVEALRSFQAASQENGQPLTFEQFRARYPIIDPGLNVKNLKHDNFVWNLSEQSYKAMLAIAERVLGNSPLKQQVGIDAAG